MKILKRGSRRESKEVASVFPTRTLHFPRRKQNLKIRKIKLLKKYFIAALECPIFSPDGMALKIRPICSLQHDLF